MESKRKKPQVRKVNSAIPERKKSDKLPPKSAEVLIKQNGDLVEKLLASEVWVDIIFPLLQESIAGVCGRFTNGRFHKGDLTRPERKLPIEMIAGYQMALEDFHNNLMDFVSVRDKMIANKKREELSIKAPVYNPFMEDESYET